MNTKETALFLGISERNVLKWEKKGKIQGHKIGGRWEFEIDAKERASVLPGRNEQKPTASNP